MFSVNFTILKGYSCEEFIASLKSYVRIYINKDFTVTVDYSKEFTQVKFLISSVDDYNVCSNFVSYAHKIMSEKNIEGFPFKLYFLLD